MATKHIPTKRRITSKQPVPTGIWSVKTVDGFVVEGVSESRAWAEFLRAGMDAQLLKGVAQMAVRGGVYTGAGAIAL
jgi:hypothetical protein